MKKTYLFLALLLCLQLPIIAQSTASKQVSTFTIEAPQLQTHKKIWVYLPKSYDSTDIDYPVIYMFDAQNLFDAETSFVGEWNVDEYLDTLKANESIIIGIAHGNEKRIDELTPFPNDTYGGGQGDLFLDFIIQTVKPHVDVTYRTLTEAEHTSIIGSSLGGLMAFYAIVKYSDTFRNAGVMSPAFWINPEIYDVLSEIEFNLNSRFYFLAGSDESETMAPNIEKMIQILIKKGVRPAFIKQQIIDGGQHNESFWSNNFPQVYDWLVTSE